jgi:hypothetical protein
MLTRRHLTPIAALFCILLVAACGSSSSSSPAPNPNAAENSPPGDIPDNQAFVRYGHGAYSVKVPEGWGRSANGGAVTFTDKLNSIRLEEKPAALPLTVREARQTANGLRDGKASGVTRPAGHAVRITYLAPAPANSVTGKAGTDAVERYVFFHKDRELVVTLSGPKGADNVDPWRIVTDSVRWTA